MGSSAASARVIILANGTFPRHPVPISLLQSGLRIICCDGAVDKLVENGLSPYRIIGDMDSISVGLRRRFQNILEQDADQDTNDLTKAINWCETEGLHKITILGATGLREDHTLGNIYRLMDASETLTAEMLTDTGRFTRVQKRKVLRSSPGEQISVFTQHPDVLVTSDGLKYPLNNTTFSNIFTGSLNESISNQVTIQAAGGNILVYQQYATGVNQYE